ncbi:MAG: PQQ-binding-like beta-propeller repeat protein, partial [Planctomycetota bacterium]
LVGVAQRRVVLAPPPAQSRRFRAETEFKELATLVADDATLVALTGVPSAPFAPERTLVALDPRTGSVLWSVALSDGLDDELAGARFAGPPVLVEGVAILVAIDNDPAKRTLVHRLVGYDVRTGERLWNTPVASTGLRQYSESFTPSDGIASVAGDVVHSSTVGAITRVEARTGRVVWTREEPVAERARVGSPPAPWRFQVPALTPDRLFVLAPDRRWVLGLDPDTGERTGRSRASNWDDPHTLTLVGDTLVGVAQRRVVLAPADRLDDASDVRAIVNVSGPDGLGIRGRVVRSGPRLFFPVTTGLVALEVPQPDEAWLAGTPAIPAGELIPLDFPGNTLALEGQLIVADDARVHSYFAWDVAREMLLERETAAPADPVPAVTYAQLAYRAGEVDDIAPALDRAVDALASDPLRPSFDALRRAIFDAVLSMARPDRDPSRLASLTPSMRRDLLDRLAQLARTPDERVASLMTAGAYFEAIGDAPRAIARYQRLLASPALRERQHDTAGLRANAGDEASRRLVSLVAFGGRKVYAPYDRAADARIDALRDDAPVEDLRAIALEFPLARRTPSLYMRIGELHEERGEERAAIEAYETGLRRLLQGESRALASELAGRAVIGSALAGRPTAARLRLREAGAFLGDAGLTYRGRALDGLALAARLRELERDEQQRPRIARTIEPDPAVLPGLRVQRPILRVGARTPTDAVILSRAGGDALEVHVVDDAGELVRTPVDLKGHDPLYLDDDAIFTTTLPRDTKGRRVFHRTDIRTGREQWSTPPFEDLWDPDLNPGFAPPPGAIAPDPSLLDNPISRELLVCFSEDVLLLVERTGRVVGVDARTGAPLWARRLPMVRVVDAHADGGVLAAVGLRRRTLQELARARNEPPIVEERLAAIDVRTGAMLHDPALDARVQWVRVTPAGDAIVGAEGLVQRHDLRSGRLVTTLPVDDLPQSEGVAHVPGRVFVLSPFGPLIAIDTDSGRLSWQRVDTGGRIVNRGGHFEAHPIGDRVYLASRLGFCAIDENSVLVTADARSEGDVTLIPAFTDDSVVTVDARGEGIPSRGLSTYRLALRDLATARLTQRPLRFTIPNAPDALHVLDGHVLVSAGASTLVFRAPPASGLARPAREAFDLESVYARPDGPVPTIAPTPAPTAPQDEEL